MKSCPIAYEAAFTEGGDNGVKRGGAPCSQEGKRSGAAGGPVRPMSSEPYPNGGQSFDKELESALPVSGIGYGISDGVLSASDTGGGCRTPEIAQKTSESRYLRTATFLRAPEGAQKSATRAGAAYTKLMRSEPAPPPQSSGWQIYKDDQLLRNPGGRYYFFKQRKVANKPGPKSVSWLIGRDFSGVVGNIRSFFANIFKGSTILYRNDKNQIQQGHQTGLLASLGNFFRDLAGALSFGAYHPDSQKEPQGFTNRLLYSVSKLKEAFLGDLVDGVPASVNHMAQNAILSGWHLVEVLPDALIGRFAPGRKLTTTIFDDGQVAVEYLTDVIPSGDAWLRVHASDWEKLEPPVIYNLKMPEHYNGDTRWRYVRNTPFRKTIETIGALVADGFALDLLGHTGGASARRNQY